MKASTKFCVILALVLGVHMLDAHTKANTESKAPVSEEYLEDNKAWPGMFFSSENVVEEYEYDDAYVLLYDDADANMFNVEIVVDLETYQLCMQSHKTGKHIVGTLVLNDDYSYDGVEVFTFMKNRNLKWPTHQQISKRETIIEDRGRCWWCASALFFNKP